MDLVNDGSMTDLEVECYKFVELLNKYLEDNNIVREVIDNETILQTILETLWDGCIQVDEYIEASKILSINIDGFFKDYGYSSILQRAIIELAILELGYLNGILLGNNLNKEMVNEVFETLKDRGLIQGADVYMFSKSEDVYKEELFTFLKSYDLFMHDSIKALNTEPSDLVLLGWMNSQRLNRVLLLKVEYIHLQECTLKI